MSRRRADDLEPLPHFVYIHTDAKGVPIYVGMTTDPENRPHDTRKRPWIKTESREVTVSPEMPHAVAVWLEATLIRTMAPRHNVQAPKPVRDEIDWRVKRICEAEGATRTSAQWAVRYFPEDPDEFEALLAKRVAALTP